MPVAGPIRPFANRSWRWPEPASINAVQLDIKDEGGEVGYASSVPLATTTGAAMGHYDARSALDQLHGLGVRVIGRIVCFLDPHLASWAWANERTEMLVLQGSGGPLATDYGEAAFTNVANAEVRQYQIDLAVEAARLGFDEILYDYVRRPEGDTAAMYFPDLQGAPSIAVARFVADTNAQLAADSNALFGVSVFGIAATRPEQIAQDIGLIAPHVDYVAPMVYPSHWGSGEYDVADPNRQPADIVNASVSDFAGVVAGSGAAVVPWLQDFSAGGVAYGPVEVRAQIDAALTAGASGFLLWNSGGVLHRRGASAARVRCPVTRCRASRQRRRRRADRVAGPTGGDVDLDLRSVRARIVDLQGDGQGLIGDELLVGANDERQSLVALDAQVDAVGDGEVAVTPGLLDHPHEVAGLAFDLQVWRDHVVDPHDGPSRRRRRGAVVLGLHRQHELAGIEPVTSGDELVALDDPLSLAHRSQDLLGVRTEPRSDHRRDDLHRLPSERRWVGERHDLFDVHLVHDDVEERPQLLDVGRGDGEGGQRLPDPEALLLAHRQRRRTHVTDLVHRPPERFVARQVLRAWPIGEMRGRRLVAGALRAGHRRSPR